MQIPHADKGLICPLHKADMSRVCHKCPLWTRVQGKDPQSEEMMDRWACALALLPVLLVENAQMARGTSAAVESLRNNLVQLAHEKRDTIRTLQFGAP